MKILKLTVVSAFGLLSGSLALAQPPSGPMSFFLTSAGSGDGGNLGGLQGADRICQNLAQAAGHGNRTWRAYLSTQGGNAVNARDRIGPGPWFNADGAQIAANVDALHSTGNRLSGFTAVDERGNKIPGSGYSPNRHDILTGSQPDGRAYPAGDDMTCGNWTSNSEGSAWVGHADRYSFEIPGSPWNASHGTPGCTPANLVSTGGAGLFYCFAID